MKIERTKNASRNIIYGMMMQLYKIIVPFIMRTILVYYLGAQYLGLNSLFASVLQVLNLAELGVGSAMVYSMYKPIAEDDNDTICALMVLYKKYYRIIGSIILVIGIVITPIIPKLVKTETVPDNINLILLYYMNLGATVLTYWLFAYKNCLLSAFQRNDIASKITMISSTVTYILQFCAIVLLNDFYAYYVIVLGVNIVNNIFTAIVVNKIYPNYKPKGKLDSNIVSDINQRVKDLFTSKIGWVIYDSADTIVISAFMGMTVLAVYQNYFYIITALTTFINVIFSSVTAGIGNSIVVETKDKNFKDFKKFTFIICWLSGFCACCLLSMYQPFMELWMGKKLMLDMSAVVCFVVYFFTRQINSVLNLYKDASGMWHEDKFRPLVAALTNLGLNLVLVQFIGIYGVILSTVIAILFVGEPWLLINLFTVVFERSKLIEYLKKLVFYSSIVICSCALTYALCKQVALNSLWLTMIFRLLICVIISNLGYVIMFRNTDEFYETLVLADKMTKGKLHIMKLGKKK